MTDDTNRVTVQYIIRWQDRVTGYAGYGEAMSLPVAEAWCAEMNNKYPAYRHWVEAVYVPKVEVTE